MVWSVSSVSLFSYIRDCYTRRQPVNSVYIVYCILRIYQHKSYLANTKKCGGGESARNVYRGGLGLSLLYTRGRQVKHGWKVMKCGGALMYHCRTTVACTWYNTINVATRTYTNTPRGNPLTLQQDGFQISLFWRQPDRGITPHSCKFVGSSCQSMLVSWLINLSRLVDCIIGLSLPGLHICYGHAPLLKEVEGAPLWAMQGASWGKLTITDWADARQKNIAG